MKVERAWYEVSPYLHLTVGVATIFYAPGSMLMKGSAMVLLAAAMTIIGMRWVYRRDLMQHLDARIDQRKYVALITQDLFYDADIK